MKAGKKFKLPITSKVPQETKDKYDPSITKPMTKKVDVFTGSKRKSDIGSEVLGVPKKKIIKIPSVEKSKETGNKIDTTKTKSLPVSNVNMHISSSTISTPSPNLVQQPKEKLPTSIKVFSNTLPKYNSVVSPPNVIGKPINARKIQLQSGTRTKSPLKPILPATSTTTSRATGPTSPSIFTNLSHSKKVILPSTPIAPRLVLPKMSSNTQPSPAHMGPVLIRSGDNLVRLVPSQTSQSTTIQNPSQTHCWEKVRKSDGTIVQILKPQMMHSPNIQKVSLSSQIVSGNVVQVVQKGGKNMVSSSSIGGTSPTMQIGKSAILKGGQSISNQSCVAQQATSLPKTTNFGYQSTISQSTSLSYAIVNSSSPISLQSTKTGGTSFTNISPITAPRMIKLSPRNTAAITNASQNIVQKVLSTSSFVNHPIKAQAGFSGGTHRIVKHGAQSRVVIQSPASSSPLVQPQKSPNLNLGIAKKGIVIPSVSSLTPGIPTTLPDDFLDTGDSDSDKSSPPDTSSNKLEIGKNKASVGLLDKTGQATKEKDSIIGYIEIKLEKSVAPTRSSSRGKRANKKDAKEGDNESESNSKSNEIVDKNLIKPIGTKRASIRTRNLRGNTEEASTEGFYPGNTKATEKKDNKILPPKNKTAENITNPLKRSSRTGSKLQKAVVETNTKSMRLNSLQKSKSASNSFNKTSAVKPGLRSSGRKR